MAKNTYKQDEVLEEPFDIKHLLRASSYIKKYAKRMVFAILLSGIGGASGYVAPMIIQRALDLAIPEKNERLLFSLVGMLVGIYLVSVIFTTIRSRIMVDVSQSIIYDIRKDLFAHLQELPFQYYDDRPHGKILIRVVNYVNSVNLKLSESSYKTRLCGEIYPSGIGKTDRSSTHRRYLFPSQLGRGFIKESR